MPISTASVVNCPMCGAQTATYCYGGKKPDIKTRYRKCTKCDCRVKTIQRLDVPGAPEEVSPKLTVGEATDLRQEGRRQAGRRRAMNQVKLTERDVAEIKYLVHNEVQTQAYTALQYEVDKSTIHRIMTGACFADIPVPKTLRNL